MYRKDAASIHGTKGNDSIAVRDHASHDRGAGVELDVITEEVKSCRCPLP